MTTNGPDRQSNAASFFLLRHQEYASVIPTMNPDHVPASLTEAYCPFNKQNICTLRVIYYIHGTEEQRSAWGSFGDWLTLRDLKSTISHSSFNDTGVIFITHACYILCFKHGN